MDEEKFNQIKYIYDKLERKITKCEESGESIVPYVKKQIEIMEVLYKNFIKTCDAQGITRNVLKRCSAEIWYNTRLQILAQKIALSTDKYIQEIKTIADLHGLALDDLN